jgi:hypothetical protein
MKANIACLLLALMATSAYASPKQFTADYTLSTMGLEIGEARRTLRADGDDRFVFESLSIPKGIATWFISDRLLERSVWQDVNGQVRPQEYLYRRSGGRKNKLIEMSFDWKDHVVQGLDGNRHWHMDLPEGTLDKLSFQLALMQDLKQGKRKLSYRIADKGEVIIYNVRILGNEGVKTPLGTFKTIKVQQVRKSNERGLTLWAAPSLDFMPVKIEYKEKDGQVYRSLLRSLQGIAGR